MASSERKLVQAYDAMKDLSVRARAHQDREAWLNVAFYLNEQYVQWNPEMSSVRVAPRKQGEPQDSPRPVANKIMHFVNSNLSFAKQAKPEAEVRPADAEPLALSEANVAKAYLDWLQDEAVGDWSATLTRAITWALIANEAYIKWSFDGDLKRPTFMFVPSTELASDPYATEFRRCRWAIHSQFLDPEQVYDIFGEDVPPSKMEKADQIKSTLLQDMGMAPVQQGVTVNELWMLPSRRYPDGVHAVWAAGKLLHGPTPYPYEHKQLPFTQIGVVPRPNSKHYASPVSYLRSPQVELNKYHAQRINTREAFALYKWWVPDDVDLHEDPNDNPRQILRGGSSTGGGPQIVGPPGAMPDNMDGQWLTDEMQHIAGLHEVSQGQVQGRVEAAKAIELLREADASRLALLLETVTSTISQGFWQALQLTRQFVPGPNIVQVYSPEGVAEVKRFKGSQLKPGMRIKVTVGTGLARTPAARMDQLITLWQQGILRDPEEFGRLAELATPTVLSARAADVRLARNENFQLADSIAVTANSWDDHTIHIREHNNYRKTNEFAALPDVVKLKFEHHMDEHKELELKMLADELQKQQMVMQLTGQAPVPPGATGGGPSPDAAAAGGATGSASGPPAPPANDQGM